VQKTIDVAQARERISIQNIDWVMPDGLVNIFIALARAVKDAQVTLSCGAVTDVTLVRTERKLRRSEAYLPSQRLVVQAVAWTCGVEMGVSFARSIPTLDSIRKRKMPLQAFRIDSPRRQALECRSRGSSY